MLSGRVKGRKIAWLLLALLVLSTLGPLSGPAAAHKTIEVGTYSVRFGWATEPAWAGHKNAAEVYVTNTSDKSPQSFVVPGLKAILKKGTLSELVLILHEVKPGFYHSQPLVPTEVGLYIIQFSGDVLGSPILAGQENQEMDEVFPGSSGDFPKGGKDDAGRDEAARKAAREASDRANASAAAVASMQLMVFAALGAGGGGVGIGMMSLMMARKAIAGQEREARRKGESGADALLEAPEPSAASGDTEEKKK